MAQSVVAGRSLQCGTGDDRQSVPPRFVHRVSFLNPPIIRWRILAFIALVGCFTSTADAELPIIGKVVSALSVSNASRSSATDLVSAETPMWHDNFESGWAAARRSGRPMLIFITSEHCRFCDAMKQNTLCDASIRSRLANGFVPIILRTDTNPEILARIPVQTYPTTLLAVPRGKVIAHRVGYQPPDRLHELLGLAPSSPN
ncbi:thioredoxin family protein [Rhodopirellula bahusiensis]|uniref:Protein-disulfide isomerase n=1 Tax=Rhodopirellula bahusiensis TaxID=2014065 RepID=A0A2G1W2G3_9BACT|nr:thioredoxin fold domain-containing protein [Rhodopirellula bahusiensis]PHQ32869.1 protein-disulfide isomerase [Rhodopirellula bahusiensis]